MGRSGTLRPPSSGLTYREARELCNELMARVTVSTRTYRWRRYDDVFSSGEAVAALQKDDTKRLAQNEAQATAQLQTLMDHGFIGRVSKKNDELTGLNEKHAHIIKVSSHTYYRFRKQELSSWQLRVEVLEVRSSAGAIESGSVRLGVAGQAHDLSVKRTGVQERTVRYAPESSAGDAFVGGVDFERDDGLTVDCAFGKGRHAVRASGVLRFALRRGAVVQRRKAQPLWVDVVKAPVDVTSSVLQTGVGLGLRGLRALTGKSGEGSPKESKSLMKSLKSFHIRQKSNADDVLGLSLGEGLGVDLQVVTFRDDDDAADILRAQRRARARAPFVVLRPPSSILEDVEEPQAADDLSTRMRKKTAARQRRNSTRSLSPFPAGKAHKSSSVPPPAIVAVRLVAFATRREVSDAPAQHRLTSTSPTWGSEALRRDLEDRTWRVYARVGEVRGAHCSVPIIIKNQVVLEVGAKISHGSTTTTSTKNTRKLDSLAKFTRPRVKDYKTDGADFAGERLVVAACVPRSSAHLRVSVYERLKTDLVRTRRLGIATIPLDEVPVLSAPLSRSQDALPRRASVVAFLGSLHSPAQLSFRDLAWILKSSFLSMIRALRRRSNLLDKLLARYDPGSPYPQRSPSSVGWRPSLESGKLDPLVPKRRFFFARDDVLRRKAREPEPRTFQLISAPRRNEIGRAYRNGAVTLSVWMAPTLAEGPSLIRWAARHFNALCGGCICLLVLLAYVLVGRTTASLLAFGLPLPLLYVELPAFLGWCLQTYVNRLAPGLRMSIGALRVSVWIDRTDVDLEKRKTANDELDDDAPTLARARLAVCADVDAFALRHPTDAGYAHSDFVSARSVRVQLSVDHRLLDGLANWFLGRVPLQWSPFPGRHAALRKRRGFEPTRLGCVRVDVLKVDHARCAFDHAHGEFNVARFTRDMACGKVANKIGDEAPPNQLRVALVGASNIKARTAFAVVTVRNFRSQTAVRDVISGGCVWNERFSFPCPDPSVVLHIGVYDAGRGLSSRATLVAQWLTTAKMLILDPTNIYCDPRSLQISRGPPVAAEGPRSYDLEADVRLRDRRFGGCVGPFDPREATLAVRVSYCRDPEGVTSEQLAAMRPSTALEQLRQNSEETGRKLGNQGHVERMLRDFPLLFDVRDVELTSLNMYLKDLFTGYRGARERSQQKVASKLEKKGWTPPKLSENPVKPLTATLTEDNADLRGRFKDTVFVDKVDLRNKLRDATAPEGIDLYVLARSFVGSTIQPLFSEADVLQSGFGHILSGVFSGGMFGESRKTEVLHAAALQRSLPALAPAKDAPASPEKRSSFTALTDRASLKRSSSVRPLAKRAYAYVDRMRGASKYLDAEDNARLVEDAMIDGFLLKRVRRSVVGFSGVTRPTRYHLEWCEFKARTLYYTRRDPKSGDSIGFTKKLRLGTRAYEARFSGTEIELRSSALKVAEALNDVSASLKKKKGEPLDAAKKKKFRTIRKMVTLRAPELTSAARGPSLQAWWAALAPNCAADGAWHDLSASDAPTSPRSPDFFAASDDDSDAETIASETSGVQRQDSFGSMPVSPAPG